MDDDRARLLEDLIKSDPERLKTVYTLETKERVFKEALNEWVKDFINALNREFDDVFFNFRWGDEIFDSLPNGHILCMDKYNWEYFNDQSYKDADGECIEFLYEEPLSVVNIKFEYYWSRTCSLGCKHDVKRFYITNLPRLMEILAYWKAGASCRQVVKEYIPDFFYDAMLPAKKKRGRPRKQQANSCTP